jgi:hypothetical protein
MTRDFRTLVGTNAAEGDGSLTMRCACGGYGPRRQPPGLAEANAGRALPLERDDVEVRIRIDGLDLPGRTCGPGPDYPNGHHNIHVAVQGRKGQQDLLGLTPGDAASATWQLDCARVGLTDDKGWPVCAAVRPPRIHWSAGNR